MNNTFILSYIVLWIVVILLIGVALHLLKKLIEVNGFVYNLLPKELPLSNEGIEIGLPFHSFNAMDTEGNTVSWTDSQKSGSIVLFTSSFCSTCKTVYPILNDLPELNDSYHFVLVIEGDEEYARFVRNEHDLHFPVTSITPEMFQELGLPATPFSYIMDQEMKVQYKGITATDRGFRMLIDKSTANVKSPDAKRRKAS